MTKDLLHHVDDILIRMIVVVPEHNVITGLTFGPLVLFGPLPRREDCRSIGIIWCRHCQFLHTWSTKTRDAIDSRIAVPGNGRPGNPRYIV